MAGPPPNGNHRPLIKGEYRNTLRKLLPGFQNENSNIMSILINMDTNKILNQFIDQGTQVNIYTYRSTDAQVSASLQSTYLSLDQQFFNQFIDYIHLAFHSEIPAFKDIYTYLLLKHASEISSSRRPRSSATLALMAHTVSKDIRLERYGSIIGNAEKKETIDILRDAYTFVCIHEICHILLAQNPSHAPLVHEQLLALLTQMKSDGTNVQEEKIQPHEFLELSADLMAIGLILAFEKRRIENLYSEYNLEELVDSKIVAFSKRSAEVFEAVSLLGKFLSDRKFMRNYVFSNFELRPWKQYFTTGSSIALFRSVFHRLAINEISRAIFGSYPVEKLNLSGDTSFTPKRISVCEEFSPHVHLVDEINIKKLRRAFLELEHEVCMNAMHQCFQSSEDDISSFFELNLFDGIDGKP